MQPGNPAPADTSAALAVTVTMASGTHATDCALIASRRGIACPQFQQFREYHVMLRYLIPLIPVAVLAAVVAWGFTHAVAGVLQP